MDSGIDTLGRLALFTRIALGAFVISSLLTLAHFALLAFTAGSYMTQSPLAYGMVGGGIGLINLLTFLASIVLVPLWIRQAHQNLHDAGLDNLRHSAGWAAGSFFIPFVNCWVPFTSTRALFNRSIGKPEWHADTPAGDVTSWVSCNWAALVVFSAIFVMLVLESILGVFVVMPPFAVIGLFLLFTLFLAGSAGFLFQIVTKVTRAQTQMEHVSQSDVFT